MDDTDQASFSDYQGASCEECAICLEEFTIQKVENSSCSDSEEDEIKPLNKNILKTSCKHYFHRKCIYEWVKKEVFCPICRKELVETINIEDENYLKIIDCCPDVKNVLWCVVVTSSKKTNCVYHQKIMNPKISNLLKDIDDDSTSSYSSSTSSCSSSCSSPSTSSENSQISDLREQARVANDNDISSRISRRSRIIDLREQDRLNRDPNTTVSFENSVTMEEIRNYYSNNSVLRRIQDSHINQNLENNNTQPRRNFFNIFRFFKKRTSTQTSQEQVSTTRSFRRYSRRNSRIFL